MTRVRREPCILIGSTCIQLLLSVIALACARTDPVARPTTPIAAQVFDHPEFSWRVIELPGNGLRLYIQRGTDADADPRAVTDSVVRAQTPAGLQGHVTGPAGTAVDFEHAADDAGRILLYVTSGLVLLLLLIVYRSPTLAVLPLVVVAMAYLVAAGVTYLLIKADAIQVNAEGTMLLLVLIFGAGSASTNASSPMNACPSG